MRNSRPHLKVPPTKENFDADRRNKKKLNDEFDEFKKVVERAAHSSPDMQKLMVPLAKLESAIIVAAWGRIFAVEDQKKKKKRR
jgi:hypothetical protein